MVDSVVDWGVGVGFGVGLDEVVDDSSAAVMLKYCDNALGASVTLFP